MTASRLISTFFGVGLLRPAPGTWGSAAALVLGVAINRYLGFSALVAATIIATLAGFWACRAELAYRPGEDPSEIVIDEVAGQWLTLLFPAAAFWGMWMLGRIPSPHIAFPGWIGAFVLFRLFDIWKPWLVGRADRRGDADGVMLDDLWAAVFAGVCVYIGAAIAHGLLMR